MILNILYLPVYSVFDNTDGIIHLHVNKQKGTGKTLLAKAVATESGFVFFSISASSVMSKYLGEGEKLMKALFGLASKEQPAVIFFDEIDALMSARKVGGVGLYLISKHFIFDSSFVVVITKGKLE